MVIDPDHYDSDPISSNQVLLIGAGDEANFKGVLDEVKIFEGFLAAQNVLDIYTNENAGNNWDGTPRAVISCLPPMTPFTCENTLYLANQSHKGTGVSDGVMWLHTINQETSPYSYDAIGSTPYDDGSGTGSYNAIGYNVKDNFIYATDENQLLKIDSNGTVVNLGAITGLPAGTQHYAGEFDRDGYYYVSGEGGTTNTMHKIDINTRAVVDTITLSGTVKFWDMAINQAGDKFYAMLVKDDGSGSFENDKVVEIDIATGAITTIGGNHSSMDSYISLVFADKEDKPYMMSNENGFYQVEMATGKLYPIASTADLTYLNDGTGCPDANLTDYPVVTINDVTQKEGDSGLTPFQFTVTLSQGAPANAGLWVTFTDGVDAVAPIGTAGHVVTHTGSEADFGGTIPPGTTSFEINASVVGDLYMEPHEEFYVDLYAPDNLMIYDNRGVGTIINDDVVIFRVERKESDTIVSPTTAYEQQQKEEFYTQIVNKDFDYSVVSYDKNQTNHEEFDIEDITVKIELFDHNATAPNNKLYTKYMYFESSTPQSRKKVLDVADLQIERASRDARFLVSYLLDGNGSIVYGNYANEIDYNATKLASGATESYGHSDHFAIRPANYRITLQDNALYGNKLYKTNNSTDTGEIAIAAGYPYELKVLATMDGSDIKAEHYTTVRSQELNATLEFDATGTSYCYDSNDSDMVAQGHFNYLFNEGELIGGHLVHYNVGNYKFHLEDINWTSVDKDISNDPNLDGCIRGSGSNIADASGRYGCNIETGDDPNYRDIDIDFEPYEFNITNTTIRSLTNNHHNYLYMNNLRDSLAMGIELSADIMAQGMEGTQLSNFTEGCMARDIALSLKYLITTDQNLTDSPLYNGLINQEGNITDFSRIVAYNGTAYNINDLDSTDMNLTAAIPLPRGTFDDNLTGTSHIDILYNINKHFNQPMNPVRVTFDELNATSNTAASSLKGINNYIPFKNSATGIFDTNNTKLFYYAKVAPYQENYGDVIGNSTQTPIYVAIYCGNTNQSWCDTMLSDTDTGTIYGLNSSFTQGGWYIAHLHDSNLDGKVSSFTVSDALSSSVIPNALSLKNFNEDRTGRIEDIVTETTHASFPWSITVVIDDLDPWLKYHLVKPDGKPFWKVVFKEDAGTISGVGETGNIVDINANNRSSSKMDW